MKEYYNPQHRTVLNDSFSLAVAIICHGCLNRRNFGRLENEFFGLQHSPPLKRLVRLFWLRLHENEKLLLSVRSSDAAKDHSNPTRQMYERATVATGFPVRATSFFVRTRVECVEQKCPFSLYHPLSQPDSECP